MITNAELKMQHQSTAQGMNRTTLLRNEKNYIAQEMKRTTLLRK
jgi:hypothetical protein